MSTLQTLKCMKDKPRSLFTDLPSDPRRQQRVQCKVAHWQPTSETVKSSGGMKDDLATDIQQRSRITQNRRKNMYIHWTFSWSTSVSQTSLANLWGNLWICWSGSDNQTGCLPTTIVVHSVIKSVVSHRPGRDLVDIHDRHGSGLWKMTYDLPTLVYTLHRHVSYTRNLCGR